MRYLVLIYHNREIREAWAAMSVEERAAGLRAHADFIEDLAEAAELIIAEAFVDPSLAKRVLVTEGRTTTTDGLFAETKEYLAGLYLIECENVDRAVQRAARIPEAVYGTVEVWPALTTTGLEM